MCHSLLVTIGHNCRELWWHHQMETFSALLATCAVNSPVTGEFTTQRPVKRSFDVFFYLCLNKRLCKQWWFETSSRHYDVTVMDDSSSLDPHSHISSKFYSKVLVSLQVLTIWISFLLTAACRHCKFNGASGHCDRSSWTKFPDLSLITIGMMPHTY